MSQFSGTPHTQLDRARAHSRLYTIYDLLLLQVQCIKNTTFSYTATRAVRMYLQTLSVQLHMQCQRIHFMCCIVQAGVRRDTKYCFTQSPRE